ncbi:hypothetical protein N1851_020961 [Merluccius polli]|uniref:PARP catalytic domain-containing protein n=1 Tax=Merluccius polli TaxID=89951 RepID=A0AA47NZI3_MERPO|nr:hypothetical protein N1851_020961 [Merluccius polli]
MPCPSYYWKQDNSVLPFGANYLCPKWGHKIPICVKTQGWIGKKFRDRNTPPPVRTNSFFKTVLGRPKDVPSMPDGQSTPGETYVMYHGTTRANAQAIMRNGFRRSQGGMLGPGVYLSRNLEKASRYPIGVPDSERVVFKVKVNVGNVIAINFQGHPRQDNWHDASYGEVYDTAWCPPDCGMTKSGLEEDCIWDPQRITVLQCINPIRC